MAYYTETNLYRQKKRIAAQNGTAAPQPTEFVFGGGGHDDEENPMEANPDQAALNNLFATKPVSNMYNETPYTLTCMAVLDKYELIDYEISEIGLLDQDGDMICFMNTSPRVKHSGRVHTVRVKIGF